MKKALDAVGGFKIEHRGLVDVKVMGRIALRDPSPRESPTIFALDLDLPRFHPLHRARA